MILPFIIVIVFVIVLIFARRNAPIRDCRWREDRAGDKGALRKYHCVACGAEAYRSEGPPDPASKGSTRRACDIAFAVNSPHTRFKRGEVRWAVRLSTQM